MTSEIIMCDGNKAAAQAVRLCRPDIIPIYPITPQTPLIEQLCQLKASGLLDAEIIEVEGENSALSAAIASSAAGGRAFTATSSWGLAFMFDAIMMASGQRIPLVMVDVTRETPHNMAVLGGHQDLMTLKESGWIVLVAESVQEIFDFILAAYRLSEDPRVLMPVVVAYDGFLLSHLTDRLEVPEPGAVDSFLLPIERNQIPLIDGQKPMGFFSSCTNYPHLLTEYRFKHQAALKKIPGVWEEIRKDFRNHIGHELTPMLEPYRMEDAEMAIVTMGSTAGTAKEFIDQERVNERKIGLMRLAVYRPWPGETLIGFTHSLKSLGVLDRSVAMGSGCGDLYLDILASQARFGLNCPVENFISGLGGLDVTMGHFGIMVDHLTKLHSGQGHNEVHWLDLEQNLEHSE